MRLRAARCVCRFWFSCFPLLLIAQNPPAGGWTQLILEGRAAMDSGRYGDAQRSFADAVQMLDAAGRRDITVVRAICELAAVYEMIGKDLEAIRLLNRAVGILETIPRAENTDLDVTWQGLGTAYLNRRLYFKAVQAFQKAQEFQRGVSIEQMVSCLTGLSAAYRGQRRYHEAEAVLLEARAQLERTPNVDPWLHVLLLTAIGNLYQWQHRLPEAAAVLHRAQAISEHAGTPPAESFQMSQGAMSYLSFNLAMIRLEQKHYHEARELFAKALNLVDGNAPVPPEDVARILRGLARCQRKLGEKREADAMESRAKAIIASPRDLVVDVSALQSRPSSRRRVDSIIRWR